MDETNDRLVQTILALSPGMDLATARSIADDADAADADELNLCAAMYDRVMSGGLQCGCTPDRCRCTYIG